MLEPKDNNIKSFFLGGSSTRPQLNMKKALTNGQQPTSTRTCNLDHLTSETGASPSARFRSDTSSRANQGKSGNRHHYEQLNTELIRRRFDFDQETAMSREAGRGKENTTVPPPPRRRSRSRELAVAAAAARPIPYT